MSKKKPMPARDRAIVEFGKNILADPQNGMDALAGMSPVEPVPAEAEREELAKWCDERADDAGDQVKNGPVYYRSEYARKQQYYKRISTLLRQPQVPPGYALVPDGWIVAPRRIDADQMQPIFEHMIGFLQANGDENAAKGMCFDWCIAWLKLCEKLDADAALKAAQEERK